jgi:predicted RNase H-like nuclease (RuvC/YqgF family)
MANEKPYYLLGVELTFAKQLISKLDDENSRLKEENIHLKRENGRFKKEIECLAKAATLVRSYAATHRDS